MSSDTLIRELMEEFKSSILERLVSRFDDIDNKFNTILLSMSEVRGIADRAMELAEEANSKSSANVNNLREMTIKNNDLLRNEFFQKFSHMLLNYSTFKKSLLSSN